MSPGEEELALQVDDQLEAMKEARKGPGVLKMRLVNLRAQLQDELIFVFEGDEDKGCYFQWIRAINPALAYEPFPCGGKTNVLELRRIVNRDVNGLARNVYFFVDRDFDDLRGEQADDSIFMTDQYSVENYLVTEEVLVELLKNDFHCHAEPGVRAKVLAEFHAAYKSFLAVTRPLNFRLFIARRIPIDVKRKPAKISHVANVDLNQATASVKPLEEALMLAREPTTDEVNTLTPEFDALTAETRYRGKFAAMFFLKWLALLADARREAVGPLFDALEAGVKIRVETITLEALASKSLPPPGLAAFLQSVQHKVAA